MIVSYSIPLEKQIADLTAHYPDLSITQNDSTTILLQGSINVCRIYNDYSVDKDYQVKICISKNGMSLPYVVSLDNYISSDYPHQYSNGMLCLETDTAMYLHFIDGFNLVEWMRDYVEVYFFSYEYYQRYLTFPFGERGHGVIGICQTYKDYLHCNNLGETLRIMNHIVSKSYRGHEMCPCGSQKKLRQCHGRYMMNFYNDERKYNILKLDYSTIVEAIKNEQQDKK